MTLTETTTLLTPDHLIGKRIDAALALQFPTYSRTYFQYLIELQSILINGQPEKKRYRLQPNDTIEILFQPHPEIDLEPQNIPLDILFEDDHIIVINKPAGMVTHPAAGNPTNTLVNALLYHCNNLPNATDQTRPGIVHRLDKDTSGVIVCAKTKQAHEHLVNQFANRQVKKEYLAITRNRPQSLHIDAPIGRHPTHRKKMAIQPETGKPAQTHFEILATATHLFLIRAKPITGRTHQIRVHLHHLNAPILGDTLYSTPAAHRQLLHAHTLHLTHPHTNAPLTFIAPPPSDLQTIIDKIMQ